MPIWKQRLGGAAWAQRRLGSRRRPGIEALAREALSKKGDGQETGGETIVKAQSDGLTHQSMKGELTPI